MRKASNLKVAFLVLVLPVAIFADVTGTVTLTPGQVLSLDNGTTVRSGGDLQWNGSAITFVGKAMGLETMDTLAVVYNGYSETEVAEDSSEMTQAPIPGTSLATFPIILAESNGGNFAKVLTKGQTGNTITLEFDTFGISAPTGPTVTGVINNYGLIPAGFSNSGIAQGSLFIIQGSNLASATSVSALESTTAGLPATLNGATVSVTVNGTTVNPVFYYAENIQLALVMPSNTPVGSGILTVTYNGQTSSQYSIQVVPSAFGFLSADQTGAGLARAVNITTGTFYDLNDSVPPNTIVSFYGSGLGADPTRDTTFSNTTNYPFTISGLAAVYVGGIEAQIQYQGASGWPGLNQVNVVIPGNAPTGCFVAVVGVTADGIPTNTVTLPIGNGACEESVLGYSGTTLTQLTSMSTLNTGFLQLLYSVTQNTSDQGGGSSTFSQATADFQSTTGPAYLSSTDGSVSIGSCVTSQTITGSASSTGTTTGLTAGNITLTSPLKNAAVATLGAVGSTAPGVYEANLSTGFVTSAGGTYVFNATPGSQVGSFSTQVVFPTPLLNWTNQSDAATIMRSQDLQVAWTGGASDSYVVISGNSSSTLAAGTFTCLAPVSAQQFTIPSYILEALPASANGSLAVGNETIPQSFTASGLNFAYVGAFTTISINSVYQ